MTSRQVAFADKILLNKIDLVTDAEKREVTRRIKVRRAGQGWLGLPAGLANELCRRRLRTGEPYPHRPCPPAQAINRTSEVIECQQARVDLKRILGLQSFDLEQILAMDPAFLKVGCLCVCMRVCVCLRDLLLLLLASTAASRCPGVPCRAPALARPPHPRTRRRAGGGGALAPPRPPPPRPQPRPRP